MDDKQADATIELLKHCSRNAFEAGFKMGLEGRVDVLCADWITRAIDEAYAEWELKKLVFALTASDEEESTENREV